MALLIVTTVLAMVVVPVSACILSSRISAQEASEPCEATSQPEPAGTA